MSIAKLKLDECVNLDFGCSITGAAGQPQARFIIENKDYHVSFPCEVVNETMSVKVDNMSKLFSAGEYKARLEVVIENKLYTPLQDTIVFEPGVAINMTPKIQNVVKESVKVSDVKVNVINEDILRKAQAATIIAQSLNYVPKENESPESIVKMAIESTNSVSKEQLKTIQEMLVLAEEVGIKV